MKYSLIMKQIIIYLFLAVILFTLLNTFGSGHIREHVIQREADKLYENARSITSDYINAYYKNWIDSQQLVNILQRLSRYSGSRLWLVGRDGNLILDSDNLTLTDININDMHPGFFSRNYYYDITFPGLIESPQLSVIFPITSNSAYTVKGFLVLHTPMEGIEQEAIDFTDILNICLFIVLGVFALLFVVNYILFIHPLNKILKAAKEYSNGNYDYELKLNTHDSFRDLGNTMKYIVDEVENLHDYQKKFIANISHDFRSPLTSMSGYAEAMIDGTIPPELHEKYLNIILFETGRLTKLTSSLLELNNFENNGVMLDLVSFDINSIIKHTAASFEGTCKKKKIVLKLEFSEKEQFVDADMGKIQQVLYNLLDNAIKFSHNDSSIYISTEEKNEKVYISVKDQGIGIPQDSIMKIWDRFYKTDLSRGKDKRGSGLGLSITKEIINAHGEQITVTSTEAVGTTFSFTLPVSEE